MTAKRRSIEPDRPRQRVLLVATAAPATLHHSKAVERGQWPPTGLASPYVRVMAVDTFMASYPVNRNRRRFEGFD